MLGNHIDCSARRNSLKIVESCMYGFRLANAGKYVISNGTLERSMRLLAVNFRRDLE